MVDRNETKVRKRITSKVLEEVTGLAHQLYHFLTHPQGNHIAPWGLYLYHTLSNHLLRVSSAVILEDGIWEKEK
jgi:hypothetical protein